MRKGIDFDNQVNSFLPPKAIGGSFKDDGLDV